MNTQYFDASCFDHRVSRRNRLHHLCEYRWYLFNNIQEKKFEWEGIFDSIVFFLNISNLQIYSNSEPWLLYDSKHRYLIGSDKAKQKCPPRGIWRETEAQASLKCNKHRHYVKRIAGHKANIRAMVRATSKTTRSFCSHGSALLSRSMLGLRAFPLWLSISILWLDD